MPLDPSRRLSESISVVLVHGAFVDASGWRKVYEVLSQDGYEVLVVQNSAVTFAAAFSADIDPAEVQFMVATQSPWGLEAVLGKVTSAAWKAKPSFYLLATRDRMIPAQAQAAMAARAGAAVVEVSSSHAVMLSQPDEVTALIRTATGPNPRN